MHKLSVRHKQYVDYINCSRTPIVIGIGPAGCGKTFMACNIGLHKLLTNTTDKLVITRPAVCVDEEHGHLPGDIHNKMGPYLAPIYDCFMNTITKRQLEKFVDDNKIVIVPLAFMRGRTFDDAYIIADETQNITQGQMKMLLTRLGNNAKLVINGDIAQCDIGVNNSGLVDVLARIERQFENKDESVVGLVKFLKEDIKRSDVVKHVLELYEE